jgi:hypothetical protein
MIRAFGVLSRSVLEKRSRLNLETLLVEAHKSLT